MYEILLYTDSNGKSEIADYISELKIKNDKDSKIKFKKIVAYIRKLREYGLALDENFIKHLNGEIWELRPIKDRILFAYYTDNKFVLLSVFRKETKKTPRKEIEKAKRFLLDFKRRSE